MVVVGRISSCNAVIWRAVHRQVFCGHSPQPCHPDRGDLPTFPLRCFAPDVAARDFKDPDPMTAGELCMPEVGYSTRRMSPTGRLQSGRMTYATSLLRSPPAGTWAFSCALSENTQERGKNMSHILHVPPIRQVFRGTS